MTIIPGLELVILLLTCMALWDCGGSAGMNAHVGGALRGKAWEPVLYEFLYSAHGGLSDSLALASGQFMQVFGQMFLLCYAIFCAFTLKTSWTVI